MRINKKKKLCIFFFWGIILAIFGQNYCDYSNTISFADFLIRNGHYEDALLELKRILFFVPNDSTAKRMLLNALCQINQPELQIRELQLLFNKYKDDTLIVSRYIRTLIYNKKFSQALKEIDEINISENFTNNLKMELYLFTHKWQLIKEDPKSPYYNCLQKIKQIKWKSPFLAGFLSAVLPGAGKFYTSYYKDGLFSFIIVATTGGLAYYALKNKGFNSGLFWFNASFSFSFYVASIYGSIKSALIVNEKKYNKLITECLNYEPCVH